MFDRDWKKVVIWCDWTKCETSGWYYMNIEVFHYAKELCIWATYPAALLHCNVLFGKVDEWALLKQLLLGAKWFNILLKRMPLVLS